MHTISNLHKGVCIRPFLLHANLSPAYVLSCPQFFLPLCLPHLLESEHPEDTLPVFMSLQLKWLRRCRLGDRAVGGGWTWLGHGALLLGAGRRGWAAELCNGKRSQDGTDRGREAAEAVALPPQRTQGFGYFSFG